MTANETLSKSRLERLQSAETAAANLAREFARLVSGVEIGQERSPTSTSSWSEEDTDFTSMKYEEGNATTKLAVEIQRSQRQELVSPEPLTTIARVTVLGLHGATALSVGIWVVRLHGEPLMGSASVETDAASEIAAVLAVRLKEWAAG